MHAWEAIQQSADYIEAHITEDMEAEALAELVGLSPFYFQRLFKRLVNKTVQDYIRLRRLSRVLGELDAGKRRILDIALDYGFSSHANFTRAFKEAYGIPPEEYKRTHPRLNTFVKPEISMNYIMMDEGVPLIAGDIVLEIHRKTLDAPEAYLGLSREVQIPGQMPVGESTGIDVPGQLWEQYHTEKKAVSEYIISQAELGMSHTANLEKGTFVYFAGGRTTDAGGDAPEGFVRQSLPAGEYIVCRIEAEDFEMLVTTALDQALQYLFRTWLPGHGLATQPFSAETYDRDAADICYMEIWLMLV